MKAKNVVEATRKYDDMEHLLSYINDLLGNIEDIPGEKEAQKFGLFRDVVENRNKHDCHITKQGMHFSHRASEILWDDLILFLEKKAESLKKEMDEIEI